jgi:hypothetical protein
VMLIVAFLPSAIRLHKVGYDIFIESIKHIPSVYVAALCIVLMAETGQVVFSLAAAVNADRWQRRTLYAGAFICTLIAITGNAAAVKYSSTANVLESFNGAFKFLETFAPPILTLVAAQVLKSQILHAIAARFEAKNAYTIALADWHHRIENANAHHDWMSVYANALRDEILKANRRSYALMRTVSPDEWRVLILREINAERWYIDAEKRAHQHAPPVIAPRIIPAVPPLQRIQQNGKTSGTHTRELDNAITANADHTFTAICPHCKRAYTKGTSRAAINALVAHTRRCTERHSTADRR